ncbi:MAG: type II secretion system F family protein [Planctomycetia bacterium]|nr:type II secretion system F family protein [Planctomycetia bacterium]
MISILVSILAFVAVFIAVFAINSLMTDLRSSEARKVRERMEEQSRTKGRQRVRSALSSQDLTRIAADAAAKSPANLPWRQKMAYQIEQSGLNITVNQVLAITSITAVFAGIVGAAVAGPIGAGVFAGVCGVLPWGYVLMKRNKRIEKLRSQLPDAFELMSRVLRAGQTISQAMYAVSEEFAEPISTEFMYCTEQMNLGLSPEGALREMGRRTGILEIKIFVLSVVVHRQTGGNLAELLDKLGDVVRERYRIRAKIRSLTAQGRFQAGILLSLPVFMFALLMLINYEYEVVLLSYPLLILTALGLMAMGALWIRKVINFDY